MVREMVNQAFELGLLSLRKQMDTPQRREGVGNTNGEKKTSNLQIILLKKIIKLAINLLE